MRRVNIESENDPNRAAQPGQRLRRSWQRESLQARLRRSASQQLERVGLQELGTIALTIAFDPVRSQKRWRSQTRE